MPGTPPSKAWQVESFEKEAWDDVPTVAQRNLGGLTDREIETIVFAGVVGVVAVGLIAGFWAMRRRQTDTKTGPVRPDRAR